MSKSDDKVDEAFEAWLLDYKIREVSTPPRRIVWQAAVAWGRAQGRAEGEEERAAIQGSFAGSAAVLKERYQRLIEEAEHRGRAAEQEQCLTAIEAERIAHDSTNCRVLRPDC